MEEGADVPFGAAEVVAPEVTGLAKAMSTGTARPGVTLTDRPRLGGGALSTSPQTPRRHDGPVPPTDLQAERAVLGSVLIAPESISFALDAVHAEDFYDTRHRLIWSAMAQMSNDREIIDPITVHSRLRTLDIEQKSGGLPYLMELAGSTGSSVSMEHYARTVARLATVRRVLTATHKVQAEGYQASVDPDAFVELVQSSVVGALDQLIGGPQLGIADVVKEVYEGILRRRGQEGDTVGIATGFRDLDRILLGFHPTDLVVLAARPAMGKTALALNLALNVAAKRHSRGDKEGQHHGVMVFSLEMGREQLVMRLLAQRSGVGLTKLRRGDIDTDEEIDLRRAAGDLHDLNLFIDDTPALSPVDVRARAKRIDLQYGLDLVVVDYLQLMKGTGGSRQSRENEISEISRSLKGLAKELGCTVLALSQLNRGVEGRSDKRPLMSDLRECVTGDTLVSLADGRRVPIGSLVGQEPEVLTLSAQKKITVGRSDKVWSVGRKQVFSVHLASGRTIRATGEHRLLGAAGWQRVESLAAGDRLALARRVPEPAETERWSDDRLILLGQMVGDGSYLSGQPMRYTTASEDNSEAVRGAAEREFDARVSRHKGRGAWHQLVLANNGNRWHPRGVNKWLRDLGIFNQRSADKTLPEEVFRLADDQIALLLRHLWATDGCISVRPKGQKGSHRVFFATCSRRLAADVAALLLRLGMVARIRSTISGSAAPVYSVDVSGGHWQRRFLATVGAFGPRREPAERLQAVLDERDINTNVDTVPVEIFELVRAEMRAAGISHRQMAARRGTSYGGSAHFRFAPSRAVLSEYASQLDNDELRAVAESDLFWDRVVAVESVGEEEVYDLTVPGTASWLADGIVSHNSGAIEQDADVIMFIYRDHVYNPETASESDAELNIAKHRAGATGKVELHFEGAKVRFSTRDDRFNDQYTGSQRPSFG